MTTNDLDFLFATETETPTEVDPESVSSVSEEDRIDGYKNGIVKHGKHLLMYFNALSTTTNDPKDRADYFMLKSILERLSVEDTMRIVHGEKNLPSTRVECANCGAFYDTTAYGSCPQCDSTDAWDKIKK